jgi:hypothetical protein
MLFAENGWEMEIGMGWERKQRRRRVLFLEDGDEQVSRYLDGSL